MEGPQAIPSSEAGVLVPGPAREFVVFALSALCFSESRRFAAGADRSKTFINCSDIRRRTALMYASAIGSRDVAGAPGKASHSKIEL